jgi:predicted transcriptional regulator
VDWSNVDAIISEAQQKIVATGGFTVNDVAARYGIGRSTALRRVEEMVQAGKAHHVGARPGPGREKVYDLT